MNTQQMQSAIINLNTYGTLSVSGVDANKLLQGQLTCDVNTVNSNACKLGALCNPQGRVISLFGLTIFQGNYHLIMPRDLIRVTLDVLKKYAVFYKVELSDASEELAIFGLIDQDASSLLPQLHSSVYKTMISDDRMIIIGETSVMHTVWSELSTSYTSAEMGAWKHYDLDAGIPTIYRNTSGLFLPHDLNLQELTAISFSKGCYTGQEIIARMQYRGQLKKRMYLATISTAIPPEAGEDIYYVKDNIRHVAGTIVDSCVIANNRYKALIITETANLKDNHLFTASAPNAFFKFNENING